MGLVMSSQALVMWSAAARGWARPPTESDDARLLEALNGGAPDAFDAVYRSHCRAVHARLTRLIGPSTEREDLLQQVFLELYRALPRFRGKAPLGAFVHAITVRVGYEYLRRRARKKTAVLREEDMSELVAPGSSPEAALREREELLQVFARLDALKPKKRVAFVLNVVEGLSLEEMSRLLETDARTLGQRVASAKRELAVMFERDAQRERRAEKP
jgi:RNA polymerase sigma-70 factor (ECF subfamily)